MFFSVPAGERSSGLNIGVLVLMSGQNRLTGWGGLGRGLSPTLKAGIVASRGAEVKCGAVAGYLTFPLNI